MVLFDSYRGRYSDNPRALSEPLRRLRPDLPQTWVVRPSTASQIPDWAARVEFGSPAYLRALGAATHVITNLEMPGYFAKRKGTTYVQTWHGTPLKRLAFDVVDPRFVEEPRYLERLAADVAKWDVLVSPNPFSTPLFRQAFRYGGEVIETGYPRNDILNAPDATATREAVRASLGIEGRAVLYAPTWRDSRIFELQLDLDRLRTPGTTLLVRSHAIAPIDLPPGHSDWVLDVSEHPDIRELYLAADVLVTDYSSVMFDFAVTGRPMLFFTYDLEYYRSDLRGFYFDFEADAPGPLLDSTAAVAEALEDLESVSARYAGAYERFVARFCPLDDGGAAERVIDAVF
jgi:CDP-glycerol glycerophosphotransferase